jgi:hypothetical protein
MNIRNYLMLASIALGGQTLAWADFTPANLTAPYAVQPSAGLGVTGGVTQSFFSDLSALGLTAPGIIGVLNNVQAYDSGFNPISSFSITGVTVTQGVSTLTPSLEPFDVTAPVTYTSTLNPANQSTVNPGTLNLAFEFNSNPSYKYSYTLDTTGIPDGGFVIYDDIEARIPEPEPAPFVPAFLALGVVAVSSYRRRSRS